MKFVELKNFTKYVNELLSPEEYRELQNAIYCNETRIDTIQGTGGLKKARWRAKGKGKSGGVRVIFYHCEPLDIFLMLLIYDKSRKDDLTSEQKKHLKSLVEQLIVQYCQPDQLPEHN